jgi:high-affinity Fe2+/Pb2+ permease
VLRFAPGFWGNPKEGQMERRDTTPFVILSGIVFLIIFWVIGVLIVVQSSTFVFGRQNNELGLLLLIVLGVCVWGWWYNRRHK